MRYTLVAINTGLAALLRLGVILLRSGLLPMLALVVTAVVCHIAMNFIKPVSAVSRASP